MISLIQGFQPVQLQDVLGSDLEIWPKDIFRSGASSGHPRTPLGFLPQWHFSQGVLGHRQKPLGRFAVVLGSSSGFCPKVIFRNLKEGPREYAGFALWPFSAYRKDGPRVTDGFAPRAFSPLTKTDLGGC